jgi:hypothetical protein
VPLVQPDTPELATEGQKAVLRSKNFDVPEGLTAEDAAEMLRRK